MLPNNVKRKSPGARRTDDWSSGRTDGLIGVDSRAKVSPALLEIHVDPAEAISTPNQLRV
jgi:hypothetical protein